MTVGNQCEFFHVFMANICHYFQPEFICSYRVCVFAVAIFASYLTTDIQKSSTQYGIFLYENLDETIIKQKKPSTLYQSFSKLPFLQPLGLDLIAGCIRLTLKSRHTLEIEVYFCFFYKLYRTAHPFRAEHPCICASVCKYHEFVPNIKLTVGMSWPQ